MIIIYHSRDVDGFASGAICKRKYPDATLIGYDYGQPFPWDKISPEEDVIMIDVSLPMDDMLKLARHIEGKFTWVDHHISAINEFNNFKIDGPGWITAVLENGIAACELAWKYLFPEEPMPEAILLLGEYDTWRNQNKKKWDEEILPFQFGLRMYCTSPETFPESLFQNNTLSPVIDIINQGDTVLMYLDQYNAGQCKKAAFEINFLGHRAICLNGGGFNSDVFKSVYDPKKHDIMMPFQFNGKFWVVSLYTTKEDVNCSHIAKMLGGGGHAKASGFQFTSGIDELFKDYCQGDAEVNFKAFTFLHKLKSGLGEYELQNVCANESGALWKSVWKFEDNKYCQMTIGPAGGYWNKMPDFFSAYNYMRGELEVIKSVRDNA